jgi:hypothetical protein
LASTDWYDFLFNLPYICVGVLLDIVGESGRGHEHLELIARFTEPKRNKEFLISYRPAIAFASLFLNQIKVALSIRGKGTSQFNVLSKECVDELQAIAVGVTDSNEDQSSIDNFLHSFTSVFPKVEGISGSGVAAVKLYHLRGDELDSIVLAVPVERDGRSTTVRDVSSEFRLCGSCWTHGILLSEDTPIEFLQNQCYYADGFVHLVVLNS